MFRISWVAMRKVMDIVSKRDRCCFKGLIYCSLYVYIMEHKKELKCTVVFIEEKKNVGNG